MSIFHRVSINLHSSFIEYGREYKKNVNCIRLRFISYLSSHICSFTTYIGSLRIFFAETISKEVKTFAMSSARADRTALLCLKFVVRLGRQDCDPYKYYMLVFLYEMQSSKLI